MVMFSVVYSASEEDGVSTKEVSHESSPTRHWNQNSQLRREGSETTIQLVPFLS